MLNKLKYFFTQSWLLVVSSFVFGLLIAVANAAWSGQIETNRINKLSNLMTSVLPGATEFKRVIENQPITLGNKKFETGVACATDTSGNIVGWSFIVTGSGFADKIELVVGVDAAFEKITGYDVLYANETPGFGDKIKAAFFKDQFKGIPTGTLELLKTGPADVRDENIIAITGATVTSEAVVKAMNGFLSQVKQALTEKGLLTNGK